MLKAQYILDDWYRDGIPIWWDESDRVAFDAEARISKSRAAIERAQERAGKSKNTVHGRYFIAKPRVIGGGDFPDRAEWIEEQSKKSGASRPVSKFGGDDGQSLVQGRK